MNEDNLQDLELGSDDAESIIGGLAVQPVEQVIHNVDNKFNSLVKTVTPGPGGPAF